VGSLSDNDIINYLRPVSYVIPGVCLSVCLSACLSVR